MTAMRGHLCCLVGGSEYNFHLWLYGFVCRTIVSSLGIISCELLALIAVCLNNSALDLYTHPYLLGSREQYKDYSLCREQYKGYSLCTALYYPAGYCCVLCTALGDYCDAVYCTNYGKVHVILRCYAYSEWNLWESIPNSQVLLHAELIWGFLAYSQTRHDVLIHNYIPVQTFSHLSGSGCMIPFYQLVHLIFEGSL